MLTVEQVQKVLKYCPETGVFRWRANRANRGKAGSIAGTPIVSSSGKKYVLIRLLNRPYFAHRIAWLVVHGHFPLGQIDHIDGNGLNNRLSNLRDVTPLENARNRKRRSDNKSGVMGVCQVTSNIWQAQIVVGGKRENLGRFDSFESAVAARKAAELKYGFHSNHGSDRPL